MKEVNKKFDCVDPAPTLSDASKKSVEELESVLLDRGLALFERYRDMMTDGAAVALAKGLKCPSSALFRHEIGFVLGENLISMLVKEYFLIFLLLIK